VLFFLIRRRCDFSTIGPNFLQLLIYFLAALLLQELRKRLDKVDEWKQRREEIDQELQKVWANGAEVSRTPRPRLRHPGQESGCRYDTFSKTPESKW
jgi:hypothetical protein